DHLAIAVIGTGKFSPHALQGGGEYPILERSAIAQGAWLASQDRHVVPWIIDRFAAPIAARMLRNDAPLLANDDPIGVSVNLDRAANGAGADRVFVIVKANQAGLRHGRRQSVESIEPAAIGNELRPLLLEHLPNGVLGTFRMWMSLGIGDDLIGEPSIQLVIGLELQSRREEALANETHLVLDLTLLPARCRRAGDGLHQMMGAHLQEPPIILPVLADEDRLHRGLHIIIDATCAGAFKKGEGPLVGV